MNQKISKSAGKGTRERKKIWAWRDRIDEKTGFISLGKKDKKNPRKNPRK